MKLNSRRQKLLPFLLGSSIVFTLWVVIPVILVKLNNLLNLPVFHFAFIKALGAVLFLGGLFFTSYISREHLLTGRTTPVAIEPPKTFIAKSLYSYTRNPMYVATLISWFGAFLFLGHFLLLLYVILAFPALHLFVLYIEEPELKKLFGKEYLDYIKKVPRWLPKLK